jgi:glycosyltransferase involved in cell wall biosynthesis
MTVAISVIICAYTEDRWHDLVAAVESVQKQTLPAHEIIVVVDHNPTLWQRVQNAIPAVIAIENSGPRGLSGARNSGLALAQGDIIAFMDEDAIADPNWLVHLQAGYSQPDVIGVGGAIEPLWLGGRPAWFPEEFNWVVGCTYRGMPQSAAPVRNLIGCNMSFRRDVFTVVGGFRSGIGRIGSHPVGCEETELCIRASRAFDGAHFLYQPLARVRHRVPTSRATWRYFRTRCYFEGQSKALVTALQGSRAGLATERAYTQKTLPLGVWQGIQDGVRGEWAGLARSAAIAAGLVITTAGYLTGKLFIERKTTTTSVYQPTPQRLPS